MDWRNEHGILSANAKQWKSDLDGYFEQYHMANKYFWMKPMTSAANISSFHFFPSTFLHAIR